MNSYPDFYNLAGHYVSPDRRCVSRDLATVIAYTDAHDGLTFNPARTSGFTEIDVQLPAFTPNPNTPTISIYETIRPLHILARGFFKRLSHIPKDKEIWMGLSAGKDTRILLKLLQHYQTHDQFEIQRIRFFAYEPEHIYARKILAELGFPQENLHIYREDRVRDPDYYRLAEPPFNPNGCFCPEIEYFEPAFDYADKVLIWGSCGNELTLYPSAPKQGRKLENNLANFLQYSYWLRSQHYEKYHKWGEIIEPYLYMPYMNAIFNMSAEQFIEFDGIRDRMLRELGGTTIPCIAGHRYNYRFSDATIGRIYRQFVESRFVQRFEVGAMKEAVALMIGELKQVRTVEMNVLGLAMTYDHATEADV